MKYRLIRYVSALLLIIIMTLVAEICADKEIIFPEILALAVGGWVAAKRPWKTSTFNLWLSPTLAALFGLLLMRYSGLSLEWKVGLAFAFVALLLTVTRSTLMPAISAAILPILIGTTSWVYPLSVCVLTGVIAFVTPWLDRFLREIPPPVPSNTSMKSLTFTQGLPFWGKLLATVMTAALLARMWGTLLLIAPPLIVTLVEFSQKNTPLRKYPLKIFFLLGFAAWAGMFCQWKLYLHWGWPLWMSAALATAALFAAFEWTAMHFPPAGAIALLPTIIPGPQLTAYPWQVMAGTILFLAASLLLFPGVEKESLFENA